MAKRHIPYFSFYPVDFMNGVRGLSAQEVGVYTMILCRIYEENGPVESNSIRLSTYCGMREKSFAAVMAKLLDLGKFTIENGMISNRRAMDEISKRADGLENNSRAGKVSAEKRNENKAGTPTDVEQPFNHTDTDTDTIRKGAKAPQRIASSSAETDLAVSRFNDAAAKAGWPKVQKVSDARSKHLRKRLEEAGGADGWEVALRKAFDSDFLNGRTAKPWTGFGFDWLINAANFTKLMEGNYDNRISNTGHQQPRAHRLAIAHMKRCLLSPQNSQAALDSCARIVAALTYPADPVRLMGRIGALLEPYYDKGTSVGIKQIEFEDWAAELHGLPYWAIERACRWWKSAENEHRRRRPVEGDIAARIRVDMNAVRAMQIALDRPTTYRPPVDEPRTPPTPEEAAQRRAAADEIMAGFRRKVSDV